MKVGIIIHSHTGNTLSVAQRLQADLQSKGHLVEIQRVSAVNEDPKASSNIELKTNPEIGDYDAIILGAPVRAFSLSPVMKVYLSQVASFKNKKVNCFVTQQFPYPWMGGNRAIKQMRNACQHLDTTTVKSAIINWSSKQREEMISRLINQFSL